MNVLVIGGGGREHALCWKLSRSPKRPNLFCAPGNPGIGTLAELVPIAADDLDALLDFARKKRIDLTIVGPEDPLCAGIVDRFLQAGLRIFGPCAEAARLEGDKAFAKQLMREAGVPTAEARMFGPTAQELAQARQRGHSSDEAIFRAFQTGYDMARQYVSTRDEPVVVKAAGLARGKGVFVHQDPAEALRTLEDLMVKKSLGDAGLRVVIEECLRGQEVSVLALVDGATIYMLEPAADHKRLGDGDTGPNTGGMGAYCPAHGLSDSDLSLIERDIFVPTLDALRREDIEYRGILYAGLMLTAAGPKVLEFNCRFGDPEAQAILMRLESDLLEAIEATVDGRLDRVELRWDPRPSLCVVMASAGYPEKVRTGDTIRGLDEAVTQGDMQVFHAGTREVGGRMVTGGGRVLGVTALGDTLDEARRRAYDVVRRITFDGAQYRTDIGVDADRRHGHRQAGR